MSLVKKVRKKRRYKKKYYNRYYNLPKDHKAWNPGAVPTFADYGDYGFIKKVDNNVLIQPWNVASDFKKAKPPIIQYRFIAPPPPAPPAPPIIQYYNMPEPKPKPKPKAKTTDDLYRGPKRYNIPPYRRPPTYSTVGSGTALGGRSGIKHSPPTPLEVPRPEPPIMSSSPAGVVMHNPPADIAVGVGGFISGGVTSLIKLFTPTKPSTPKNASTVGGSRPTPGTPSNLRPTFNITKASPRAAAPPQSVMVLPTTSSIIIPPTSPGIIIPPSLHITPKAVKRSKSAHNLTVKSPPKYGELTSKRKRNEGQRTESILRAKEIKRLINSGSIDDSLVGELVKEANLNERLQRENAELEKQANLRDKDLSKLDKYRAKVRLSEAMIPEMKARFDNYNDPKNRNIYDKYMKDIDAQRSALNMLEKMDAEAKAKARAEEFADYDAMVEEGEQKLAAHEARLAAKRGTKRAREPPNKPDTPTTAWVNEKRKAAALKLPRKKRVGFYEEWLNEPELEGYVDSDEEPVPDLI